MKRYMLYTLGLLLSVMMYSCEKDEPLQIDAKTDLSGTVWEGTYTVPTYRGTWKVFVHFVTVDSVHMKFYSIRPSEENEDTSRFPLSLYGFRTQGKGHYAVEKNVLSFQLDTYDKHGYPISSDIVAPVFTITRFNVRAMVFKPLPTGADMEPLCPKITDAFTLKRVSL